MKKKSYGKFGVVLRSFDYFILGVKGLEASFVELAATIGPWLAALPPAMQTYYNTQEYLGFAPWLGATSGAAVEVLGLASAHTLAKFWVHNRKERSKGDKVPVIPIALAFVFYLALIITINAGLMWDVSTVAQRVAHIGLTLLNVPAVIIISVRAMHTNILLDRAGLMDVEETKEEEPAHVRVNVKDTVRGALHELQINPHDVGIGTEIAPKKITPKKLGEYLQGKGVLVDDTSLRTSLFNLRKEASPDEQW